MYTVMKCRIIFGGTTVSRESSLENSVTNIELAMKIFKRTASKVKETLILQSLTSYSILWRKKNAP